MKVFFSLIFCAAVFFLTIENEALAQTPQTTSSSNVSRIEYTDSQLVSFGFSQKELATEFNRGQVVGTPITYGNDDVLG